MYVCRRKRNPPVWNETRCVQLFSSELLDLRIKRKQREHRTAASHWCCYIIHTCVIFSCGLFKKLNVGPDHERSVIASFLTFNWFHLQVHEALSTFVYIVSLISKRILIGGVKETPWWILYLGYFITSTSPVMFWKYRPTTSTSQSSHCHTNSKNTKGFLIPHDTTDGTMIILEKMIAWLGLADPKAFVTQASRYILNIWIATGFLRLHWSVFVVVTLFVLWGLTDPKAFVRCSQKWSGNTAIFMTCSKQLQSTWIYRLLLTVFEIDQYSGVCQTPPHQGSSLHLRNSEPAVQRSSLYMGTWTLWEEQQWNLGKNMLV
jgi:hypothetical protein